MEASPTPPWLKSSFLDLSAAALAGALKIIPTIFLPILVGIFILQKKKKNVYKYRETYAQYNWASLEWMDK